MLIFVKLKGLNLLRHVTRFSLYLNLGTEKRQKMELGKYIKDYLTPEMPKLAADAVHVVF